MERYLSGVFPDTPDRRPVPCPMPLKVIAGASGVGVALDPTPEDAGVDLATIAGDFLKGVLQWAAICPPLIHAPDKISNAPILGLHDCDRGLQEGRQLLPFRFLVLGPLDAGRGITKVGNPFFGDPEDGLPDEVVPPLERRQPVQGGARLAGGDKPAQEDERSSDKPLAVFITIFERIDLECAPFGRVRFRVNGAVRMRR